MRTKILTILFLVLSLIVISFVPASAATPPDIINSYVVTINPQPDGSLLMKYDFDYEATTDFPRDIQYLEIGVPNTNFEIVSYEPKGFITGAKAIKSGKSQVHLDFAKLPLKGDKFKFSFVIKQGSMAYKADENNISFKFVPGWFDFAEIKELKVIVSSKGLSVTKTEPEPASKSDSEITWVTKNMKPDQKAAPIIMVCSKSSYPNLPESVTKNGNNSVEGSGNIGLGAILLIILLVIILFLGLLFLLADSDDYDSGGYGGGGYKGGYYSGSSYRSSSGSSSSRSSRSSGGSGDFSGRGSSCACVSSCACACACAGGGRVGCAERGYQVLHWLLTQKSEAKENKDKC